MITFTDASNKYIWRAYRVIKRELSNYNAFDIDERYFQLRRDLQICEKHLRKYTKIVDKGKTLCYNNGIKG